MIRKWFRRVGRAVWSRQVVTLRGFITVPGFVSLSGLGVAAATVWADHNLIEHWAALDMPVFSSTIAEAVLSTLAGAAMTALSLVYSIVLLVFTLASGNIGPRLLERFSQDRTNQVAVGMLGALFLHSLFSLAVIDKGPSFFAVAAAGALASSSVLFLLFFVDKVASRVTIDEEIARIADELDDQFAREDGRASDADADALLRPDGPDTALVSPRSGYINRIAMVDLARRAEELGSFVDFDVSTGHHVLRGDRIGLALAGDHEAMAKDAVGYLTFGTRRTASGDLRFSINLLLEIALRALSPGVNDTFTAIACIDRLTSSFANAARQGLQSGVYCDERGVARVFAPQSGLSDLIREAYSPLRRAARGNVLTAEALIRALSRLGPHLSEAGRAETERQIGLILGETKASDLLEADIDSLESLAEGGRERRTPP